MCIAITAAISRREKIKIQRGNRASIKFEVNALKKPSGCYAATGVRVTASITE
jgi:hypothetical protein